MQDRQDQIKNIAERYLATYAKERCWGPNGEWLPPHPDDPLSVQFSKELVALLPEVESTYHTLHALFFAQKKEPPVKRWPIPPERAIVTAAKVTAKIIRTAATPITLPLGYIGKVFRLGYAGKAVYYGWKGRALKKNLPSIYGRVCKLIELTQQSALPETLVSTKRHLENLGAQVTQWITDIAAGNPLQDNDHSFFLLNKMLSDIATSYFETDRPGAPIALGAHPVQTAPIIQRRAYESVPEEWHPSAQKRNEWLSTVESARNAIKATERLSQFLTSFMDKAKQSGAVIDEDAKHLITKTLFALQTAILDEEGFYAYSDREPPITRNLKALANTLFSINHSCLGLWTENKGWGENIVTGYFKTLNHSSNTIKHILQVDWKNLSPNIVAIGSQLTDAVFSLSVETLNPAFETLAQYSHQIEFDHDCRFGVLTQEIRTACFHVEKRFQERGLFAFRNAFGFTEEKEALLREKHRQSSNLIHQGSISQKLTSINTLLDDLAIYQRDERLRKDVLFIKKIKASLREHEPVLSRDALRIMQERLADDLRLLSEAERAKKAWFGSLSAWASATTPLWPPAELTALIRAAQKEQRTLKKQRCAAERYQEALVQHEKMRTHFAEWSLINQGLTPLIEAVIAGKEANQNRAEKYRLAVLYADLFGLNRSLCMSDAHRISHSITTAEGCGELLQKIATIHPALGAQLGVECQLAGYILCAPLDKDASVDVATLFDRLTLRMIQCMMRPLHLDRLTLLRQLLGCTSATTTDQQNIPSLLQDLVFIGLTNKELGKKAVIFMMRLATADRTIAQWVFERGTAQTSDIDHVRKKDKTLYSEALVHSFTFHYIDGKCENENRAIRQFVLIHQSIFRSIFHALDKPYTDALSSIDLLDTIEHFMRYNLSPGSSAETQLKSFLSAFVLCKDNVDVRRRMMEENQLARGSVNTKYMVHLTVEASYMFFEKIVENFDAFKKHYDSEIREKYQPFTSMICDKPEQDIFIKGVVEFLEKKLQCMRALSTRSIEIPHQYHAFQALIGLKNKMDDFIQRKLHEKKHIERAYQSRPQSVPASPGLFNSAKRAAQEGKRSPSKRVKTSEYTRTLSANGIG